VEPSEILIGAGAGGTNALQGAITQVRIFDSVRAQADIQADMEQAHYDGNSPQNLVNSLALDGHLDNNAYGMGPNPPADGVLSGDAHFAGTTPTLLGPNVLSGAA